MLEVYAPIKAGGSVVGAYEVYADARPLEASIADREPERHGLARRIHRAELGGEPSSPTGRV